jgi:hypothetical protein
MTKRRRVAQGAAVLGVAAAGALVPGVAYASNGTTTTSNGSAPFVDGQDVTVTFSPQFGNPPVGGWDFAHARVEAYECPGILPTADLTSYCIDLGTLSWGDFRYTGSVAMHRYVTTPTAPITTDCREADACYINIVHYGPGGATVVGSHAAVFNAGK